LSPHSHPSALRPAREGYTAPHTRNPSHLHRPLQGLSGYRCVCASMPLRARQKRQGPSSIQSNPFDLSALQDPPGKPAHSFAPIPGLLKRERSPYFFHIVKEQPIRPLWKERTVNPADKAFAACPPA
jgi:hypothetical protein